MSAVPHLRLSSGAAIPAVGLGTFGSDAVGPVEVANAVQQAFGLGYRHFDCASIYGNEREIGQVLGGILRAGTPREQLWITSKLWNDSHSPEAAEAACAASIRDLQTGYLDAYLVHWPFPNGHVPGCDASARSQDARPYIHAEFMKTWRKLEELVRRGWVRHIGTSNMSIAKLKLLLRDAEIAPALNQMELHPHFQQPELVEFLEANGILPVGFCPLGSPNRPERDRTPQDTSPLQDPVIRRIAEQHQISPAAVCLKWSVQRGRAVIPFSIKSLHQKSNLDAVSGSPLSAEELEQLSRIDRNCRLIKGQVFLWKANQSWRDLWDENGTICA